jgi:hypothetical protein
MFKDNFQLPTTNYQAIPNSSFLEVLWKLEVGSWKLIERLSRLDGSLVEEHDRDVVLDREDALAGVALERRAPLDELDLRLAVRAGEDIEQFLIYSHEEAPVSV